MKTLFQNTMNARPITFKQCLCQINFRHFGHISVCTPQISFWRQDTPHPGVYLTFALVLIEQYEKKDFPDSLVNVSVPFRISVDMVKLHPY